MKNQFFFKKNVIVRPDAHDRTIPNDGTRASALVFGPLVQKKQPIDASPQIKKNSSPVSLLPGTKQGKEEESERRREIGRSLIRKDLCCTI